jgi:hypothetical protein
MDIGVNAEESSQNSLIDDEVMDNAETQSDDDKIPHKE